MYSRRSGVSYQLKRRKWSPPKFGLCPKCERELLEELKKRGLLPKTPKPPKDLPEWVELKSPSAQKGGASQKGKQQPEQKQSREKRKKQPKIPKPEITPEDIKKAKEGDKQVREEFEKATNIKVERDLPPMFKPVTSSASATKYRDTTLISKMRTAFREWKVGYEEVKGKYGARLKVKEYIRTKGKRPFVTRKIKSAKGEKVLVIADFSSSVRPFEEQYKKAIISTMEVLDSLGVKTALFAFGSDDTGGYLDFFKIKKFEDPKWTEKHASKTAALVASGSTPMSRIYKGLKDYVKKHRPDIIITLTDGMPDNPPKTRQTIQELKKKAKMIAFGIGEREDEANYISKKLKDLGYSGSFAITTRNMSNLPKKLVNLLLKG